VPLWELPLGIRPGRLITVVVSLALVLSASSCSSTTVTTVQPRAPAAVTPRIGATAYGNDISWPQCPKDVGGHGLPGPMAGASFAVLGLTDGGSFQVNPCLESQIAAVKTAHLWAGAYAILTYPTSPQMASYGGPGTLARRLARVGAAQARFNLATMARVGLGAPLVWVDVEPNTRTPWSATAARNNAVIDGAIAGYKAAGVRVGIYSYGKAWRAITGARLLPGTPSWMPVGLTSRADAHAACAVASYIGSKPWLTQWTDDVRDYDLTCPGVTGSAARGNLLTPYLKVSLANGSRGDAVTVLQRHLGAPKTGTFGLTTLTKVLALQRRHHLKSSGRVGKAEWRALGAGTGSYAPPVRGFMGTLFVST
jgi:hypothetical protein